MRYTVFGSSGKIGTALKNFLISENCEVLTPSRNDTFYQNHSAGHVIYCCGTTSDFRDQPFNTIDGHVIFLAKVLANIKCESFNYISSTRVYNDIPFCEKYVGNLKNRAETLDLYNASKLAAEALCLSSNLANVKITRLCNVANFEDIGRRNFLPNICEQARNGNIELKSSLKSIRNYIFIDDLIFLLKRIGPEGKKSIYNASSETRISHKHIIKHLVKLTNCSVCSDESLPVVVEPKIPIDDIRSEFNFKPTNTRLWLEPVLRKLCGN